MKQNGDNKPRYKCQECGLKVDKVKPYKKGECPKSMTGHRFEKDKPRIDDVTKVKLFYGLAFILYLELWWLSVR